MANKEKKPPLSMNTIGVFFIALIITTAYIYFTNSSDLESHIQTNTEFMNLKKELKKVSIERDSLTNLIRQKELKGE